MHKGISRLTSAGLAALVILVGGWTVPAQAACLSCVQAGATVAASTVLKACGRNGSVCEGAIRGYVTNKDRIVEFGRDQGRKGKRFLNDAADAVENYVRRPRGLY